MIKTILNLLGDILVYIYDFLFDWEDDPYEEKDFIESEKLKHSPVNVENKRLEKIRQEQEYVMVEKVLGGSAADFLSDLTEEADHIINRHNLEKESAIRVVIPPEKFASGIIRSKIFEETIERVYSQYNKDVLLKPGEVNIMHTQSGTVFVEMELIGYKLKEEVFSSN